MKRPPQGATILVGREEPLEWTYLERILAVNGDSTGEGDMPMQVLQGNTSPTLGSGSRVTFTIESKDEIYIHFDNAPFWEPRDPLRFSYPADHPLASEFEEQMTGLIRDYKGDGEYLSRCHPNGQGAKDDAPESTALMLRAAAGARSGIFFSFKGASYFMAPLHGAAHHVR